MRLPGPDRAPGFHGRDVLDRPSTDSSFGTAAHDPMPHSVSFDSFTVPDAALADVPAALRGPAEPTRGAAGSAGNGGESRGRL